MILERIRRVGVSILLVSSTVSLNAVADIDMSSAGTAPLMAVVDPAKVETNALTLIGYQGKEMPKIDLLPGGKKVALVTGWDDGKAQDAEVVACLSKYGVRGTFFMCRNSAAMGQWREMESKGMEIGSHSWSHPHLDKTTPKQCLDQVVEMRRYLEKETGHPVISFAYPYGYKPANDAEGSNYVLRAMREAGYWSGRVTVNGDNRIDDIPDPLTMKPNFHFGVGAGKVKAKLDECLKKPGSILYFWGHSVEAQGEKMNKLESVLEVVAHRPDVWYTTLGDLMVWKFMREKLQVEAGTVTADGRTVTVKMPWLHSYLRQVPISLVLPEGVKEVSWKGQRVQVVDGRVQLKW